MQTTQDQLPAPSTTEFAGEPNLQQQVPMRARPDEERIPHVMSNWPSWYEKDFILRAYPDRLADSPVYRDEQAARMKATREQHAQSALHNFVYKKEPPHERPDTHPRGQAGRTRPEEYGDSPGQARPVPGQPVPDAGDLGSGPDPDFEPAS